MTIFVLTMVLSVLVWGLYEYRSARRAGVFSYLPLIMEIEDRDNERFRTDLRAARDHAEAA